MNGDVRLDVDFDLCARDGLCARECPFGLIEVDAEGLPSMRRAAEKLCIGCGHCVAICPRAALSLNGVPARSLPAVERHALPEPEQVALLFKSRRSIRAYKSEPLDRREIEALLDVARFAPSAVNSQPVHWAASLSPARTRELAGLAVDWMRSVPDMPYKGWITAWDEGRDKILHGAPHVVLAHAPDDARWGQVDCTTAAAWMELLAAANGLGTCWAGIFTRAAQQWAPLQEALNLPAVHTVQAGLMLGRPAVRYARVPERHALRLQWL